MNDQQQLPDGSTYDVAPAFIHGKDQLAIPDKPAELRYDDASARPEVVTKAQARAAQSKPWFNALGGCLLLLVVGVVALALLAAIPLGIFGLREALFGALVLVI